MVIELYKVPEECTAKMRENTEMALTLDDKRDFYNSTSCHICGCEFKDKEPRVRDHDHRTGKYRGAAHNTVILTILLVVTYQLLCIT